MLTVIGSSLRCFPHTINISVQHGLAELPKVNILLEMLNSESIELRDEDHAYIEVLRGDVVDGARTLVGKCRSSSQRRDNFQEAIEEGNTSSAFGGGVTKNALELLRDMAVRWSTTFLMIDRMLELYPVC